MPLQTPVRVGFASLDDALQDLLTTIFTEEGYDTRPYLIRPESLDELRNAPPNVLLVSVGPRDQSLAIIDALRSHPTLNSIPVIVLGTIDTVQNQAQASGNVYAALASPFDLGDLLKAVQSAVEQVPFERRITALPLDAKAFQRAAEIILEVQRRAIFAWFTRASIEDFRRFKNLGPREFLDNVPRILNALATALRRQASTELIAEDPDVRERIRIHARLRNQQGIPVDVVVHEYQILREVIIELLAGSLAPEAVFQPILRISQQFDIVVRLTITDYLQHTAAEPAPQAPKSE